MDKISVALLAALLALGAQAADLKSGADVFDTDCSDCHTVQAGHHKKGPSLAGVFNRAAASQAGFANYSAALRASRLVWTADNLNKYLSNPRTLVPGGRMKYDGLDDAQLRQDLIAFLQAHP